MKLKSSLLVVLMALSLGACTRIGPGHVGIKVSLAGDQRGVQDLVATTGWVFYNPLQSQVFEWPTFNQNVRLEGDDAVSWQTEKMTISANIAYAYHLDGSRVPHFYVKHRTDNLEGFSHGYLKNLIRDKFNEVGSTKTIDSILGDNATFLHEVRESVQKDVLEWGVMMDPQFGFIGAPVLPKNLTDSINMRVQADQIASQKQKELEQTRADMAKETMKAETYAANAIKLAEGQSRANKMIQDSLTPALLDKMKLERWDGHLSQISGVNASPFVSINGPK